MAKFQSPLLGYNNNVRHRGRVFHIQTEDSGVNHPHIITHLFMDGGRILKSVKTSYAEHVGAEGMSETVRGMMKDQHKAMIVALRDGQFDEKVEGGAVKKPSGAVVAPDLSATKAAQEPAAKGVVPPPPPSTEPELPEDAAPAKAPIAPAALAKTELAVPAATGTRRPTLRPEPRLFTPDDVAPPTINDRTPPVIYDADPPLPPELEALLRDELPPLDAVAPVASPPAGARASLAGKSEAEPATTREPSQHLPAHELTLDFDALERDMGVSPLFQQHSDLPPPPKNLFAKERGTGQYRTLDANARPATTGKPSTPQPPAAHSTSERGVANSTSERSERGVANSEGRYAPARPAAIFSGATAKQPSPSLFGDDLVGDKTLDEVILSYLAEDLDPQSKK